MSPTPASPTRKAVQFFAFWLGLGIVVGPLVGFLSGARTLAEFERSAVAGVIFMLTIGLSSEVGSRWIAPRITRGRSPMSSRTIVVNVAMRVALTLLAMLIASALVSVLVLPGYLLNFRSMVGTTVYVLAGTAIFTAIAYASQYRARVRADEAIKARADAEMETAAAIQRALLPRPRVHDDALLIAGRTIPSRVIAGDFFDHFEVGDGSLAFVIGDVAGKGPPAAILAAAIQGMLAAFASQQELPSIILGRVNEALRRRMPDSRFVTMILGIVDSNGGLRIANAGHPRAILTRRDGSMIRLERGGLPLGVSDQPGIEDEEVRLSPGDTIVLFTDGVSEARDASGVDFGEERILEVIAGERDGRPERAIEALFRAVEGFTAGVPPEDDVTVVALRMS
jgi:serine phosphatase RsbU (regulator of sigma subunit)